MSEIPEWIIDMAKGWTQLAQIDTDLDVARARKRCAVDLLERATEEIARSDPFYQKLSRTAQRVFGHYPENGVHVIVREKSGAIHVDVELASGTTNRVLSIHHHRRRAMLEAALQASDVPVMAFPSPEVTADGPSDQDPPGQADEVRKDDMA